MNLKIEPLLLEFLYIYNFIFFKKIKKLNETLTRPQLKYLNH